MAFLIYSLNRLLRASSSAPVSTETDAATSKQRHDILLWLRIYFFLCALVIISRLFFMFAFSTEIAMAGIHLQISYGFFIWLQAQAIFVMVYLYYLVLFGLFFRIKPEFHKIYLEQKTRTLLRFVYLDVFIIFTLYLLCTYTMLFPNLSTESTSVFRDVYSIKEILLFALLGLLVIYVISYIQYKKKQNTLYLKFYGISFIFILLLSICISYIHIDQYYGLSKEALNRLTFFGISQGYFGWFWIIFIMLTVLSHSMIFQIRRLKGHFITVQFQMNMMSHSLRFNFICTLGLVVFTVFPLFFKLFYI